MNSFAMLDDLARARRSVRAFRPDPVPEPVLREACALAQQAPSNCNTQPWVVHLVFGATADRLRDALHGAAGSGRRPVSDYPFTGPCEGVHRERQIASAKLLYGAMGIGREDKAARNAAMLENFRFFGAPHAAFLFMLGRFGPREAADVGMYAQTLLLALTAKEWRPVHKVRWVIMPILSGQSWALMRRRTCYSALPLVGRTKPIPPIGLASAGLRWMQPSPSIDNGN